MKKLIAVLLTMLFLTGCSLFATKSVTPHAVPQTTMELILSEQHFQDLIYTFDENQDQLMKTWLKEFLIPYISHLEVELQHSTPVQ